MNSIFTEENLLAFTTAARFGSFSKAAAELGVTTSAISYTIKRMETGLDVVLFVRNTRSIELTESGFTLPQGYRSAERFLCYQAWDRHHLSGHRGAGTHLHQSAFVYPTSYRAAAAGAEKQFPTCQITVTTEVYNGVWDSIINNRPISRLARRIRFLTAAALITRRLALSAGYSPSRRNTRWRLSRNRSRKASCASTRTSWWRTPRTPLIRRSAGCCTGRRRFWCRILTPNASVRFWGRDRFLPEYMTREAVADGLLVTTH